MLMDLRYHAASMIAVFLALALGLVIGGSLASDQKLVQYQETLIKRLETENRALRNKQQTDEDDLLLLRQDRSNLESNLNQLATGYLSQLAKTKRLAVAGSETLLGVYLEPLEDTDYEWLFDIREDGVLSEKDDLDANAKVVEVPKNAKPWELALYLVTNLDQLQF